MVSGAGSFKTNPFALNTGLPPGGVRRQTTHQPPPPPVKGPSGGGNELSDINNLFSSSIFRGGGHDGGIPNAGSTGGPASKNTGGDNSNVAKNYLNSYFQTNPAGKQVKVHPPEPPLFTDYGGE